MTYTRKWIFRLMIGCAVLLAVTACQPAAQAVDNQEPYQQSTPIRNPLLFDTAKPLPTLPPPEPTKQPTIQPTITLAPASDIASPVLQVTATPAPVIPETSYPGLVPGRPYMVYFGLEGDQPAIILMNQNAEGKKVIPLPPNSLPPFLPEALSPGGSWLAFETGQPDAALYLMHLPDGQITRLFNVVVIHALAWDQWGRKLAFVGRTGDTEKMYVFDRWNNALSELVTVEQPILWMVWSEGGDYVVYGNGSSTCEGDCGLWAAVNTNTGVVRTYEGIAGPGEQAMPREWINARTLSAVVTAPGKNVLKYIDILSRDVREVYSNVAFTDYQRDRDEKLYAIRLENDPNSGEAIEPGVYYYDEITGEQKLVARFADYGRVRIKFWGRGTYRFLMWNDTDIFGLSRDGTVTPLVRGQYLALSPDGSRIIVGNFSVSPPVMWILNENAQLIREVSAEPVGDLFWNQTGDGLFSVYQGHLYYLALVSGEWMQVDNQLPGISGGSDSLLYGWKGP